MPRAISSRHVPQAHATPTRGNRLIFGENLTAMRLLEGDLAGKVQCAYLDPPYNTGARFDLYDDRQRPEAWLAWMRPRLEAVRGLLAPSGVMFVHIDDKELAPLRMLVDEVFGAQNFLVMIVLKTSDPSGHKTVNPAPYCQTEYLLMVARDRTSYRSTTLYVPGGYDSGYDRYIEHRAEPCERWRMRPLGRVVAQRLGFPHARAARVQMGASFDEAIARFALEHGEEVCQLTAINRAASRGAQELRERSVREPGRVCCVERGEGKEALYAFEGRQVSFYAKKLRWLDGVLTPTRPLTNLWTDIPWNGIAAEGGVSFKNGKKPERLLRRCVELASEAGDWVLDPFLGSGTTAAVAHKMGRRWVGIEAGPQCLSHALPRLQGVVGGLDSRGVTRELGWVGGGDFEVQRLDLDTHGPHLRNIAQGALAPADA